MLRMGAPDPGYDPRMGGTLDWFGCATFRLRTRPDAELLELAYVDGTEILPLP